MAPIAVPTEVRVVLVKENRIVAVLVQAPDTSHQQGVSRVILLQDFDQPAAFGRAVLGVRVVVVESSAVAEHKVTLDFTKRERALSILGEVVGLVGILEKLLHPKPTSIAMGIFAAVIPAHAHARRRSISDESNGFRDDIHMLRILAGNPDLGFGAELDVHSNDRNFRDCSRHPLQLHRWSGKRGDSFDRVWWFDIRNRRN